MMVIRNYFGVPSPASGLALTIKHGDTIELLCADPHSPWWQVRCSAYFSIARFKRLINLFIPFKKLIYTTEPSFPHSWKQIGYYAVCTSVENMNLIVSILHYITKL